jgi:hypothetical protein
MEKYTDGYYIPRNWKDRICNHKWKIIRAEQGQMDTLLTLFGFRGRDVIIYHLQCERCGCILERICEITNRGFPYKILREK